MSGPSRKSFGMRLTERYLLPFFGPADLGNPRRGRGATDDDRARDTALRSGLERVVGPDGRSYVVDAGSTRRDEPGDRRPSAT